jgi:hypothetical protein
MSQLRYTRTHTIARLNGEEIVFPLAKKQPTHYNASITGLTWAAHFRCPKGEIPIHKEALWSSKGYNTVYALASAKAAAKGTTVHEEYHTALWQVLFNSPKTLILYTNKLDESQFGIIHYCLMHGITVALEDTYSHTKQLLRPVDDLHDVQLFHLHKVEEYYKVLDQLDDTLKERVCHKYRQLEALRQEYQNRYVWPAVNDTLADLRRFYEIDKIESAWERSVYAVRYATIDRIKAYNLNMKLTDFDDPRLIDQLIQELYVWARAFDIDIKLTQEDITIDTFDLPRGVVMSAYALRKFHQRRRALDHATVPELIDAYMQVKYYQEQGAEQFLAPMYHLCACGRPVHKEAPACPYCGQANPEVVEEVLLDCDLLMDPVSVEETVISRLD